MDIPQRGPLSATEFLVIEFDSRNAHLAVLDSMGYSARNHDDAIADASKAAAAAKARGLPLSYTVVRLAAEETFPGA